MVDWVLMKIMACALTYPLPNGVTASLNVSTDSLKERGYDVRIVSPDYGRSGERSEYDPVTSSVIAHKAATNLLGKEERVFGVGAKKEIEELAKDFDPHIYWLHTVTWAPNAFESHMLKSNKGKVLFYHTWVEKFGELYAGEVGSFVMKKRSKNLCNKMDAVMVPSGAVKKKLLEYGVRTPISVIRTGVDPPPEPFTREEMEKRFGVPRGKSILLYVGRISKEKNLKFLIETLQYLDKKRHNVVLLLVGPGDTEEMKEEARKKGLKEKVLCTGALEREEALKIYGACDVFVFPSRTETQGIVIEEAMLAGLPVVALSSLIEDEVYPEGRAMVARKESEFAPKVEELLEDDEKRRNIKDKAREFALKNFSKGEMIRRQIKVFEEVSRTMNK